MSNKGFKTKFKDVNVFQKEFSTTSVKAVKEIYAERYGVEKHNIKSLSFSKCLSKLRQDYISRQENFDIYANEIK